MWGARRGGGCMFVVPGCHSDDSTVASECGRGRVRVSFQLALAVAAEGEAFGEGDFECLLQGCRVVRYYGGGAESGVTVSCQIMPRAGRRWQWGQGRAEGSAWPALLVAGATGRHLASTSEALDAPSRPA